MNLKKGVKGELRLARLLDSVDKKEFVEIEKPLDAFQR